MSAGQAGRSGRKPNPDDARLIRELREAKKNEPPKRFVDKGKQTVRKARRGKK